MDTLGESRRRTIRASSRNPQDPANIPADEIRICRREDGSEWRLGEGARDRQPTLATFGMLHQLVGRPDGNFLQSFGKPDGKSVPPASTAASSAALELPAVAGCLAPAVTPQTSTVIPTCRVRLHVSSGGLRWALAARMIQNFLCHS